MSLKIAGGGPKVGSLGTKLESSLISDSSACGFCLIALPLALFPLAYPSRTSPWHLLLGSSWEKR